RTKLLGQQEHSTSPFAQFSTQRLNMTVTILLQSRRLFFFDKFTVRDASLPDLFTGLNLIGLAEKSTHAKLEMLFSKKNFQMAIDIAKSQHFEKEELARIFGCYADHLYKQKDYDGAIKEYVKTIGILEASFVIQRTSGTTVKVGGVVDALLELLLYEINRLRETQTDSKETVYERLSQLALRLLRDDKSNPFLKLWMRKTCDLNLLYQTCENKEVDRLNLATPMVVLQILSETDAEHSCLVGTIRDYLLRHLEAGASQIAALRQGVQKLRSETMRNREVVRSLNSQCFENYASNEQSCPECAPKNKKLLAETEADVLTTGSSLLSSQVVEQLRIALHTDQTALGEEPLEPFDNESSRSSSPQLTKLLANRLAHAPFGLSAGLPRPQTPSGVGSNAMQMTVLHLNNSSKDSQSIRSRDTTPGPCGSPKPTSQFEGPSADVRSPGPRTGSATLASLRSYSLGYHSADIRSATATDPAHAIQPKNPFGDSDTDDERRSLASAPDTTQTHAKTSLPDFGLGASPKTPFDP
ncbi:hypothetical protein X801_03327, partial [Opisthorchis viverrini]